MNESVSLDDVYKHILNISQKHNISFVDATLKYVQDTKVDFDEFCLSMKKHKMFTSELKAEMTKLNFFKKGPTLEGLF